MFIFGFILGSIIGACFGIIIAAIANVSSQEDDDEI